MEKNQKGMTLVEVLVASVILVISISGILYLFVENEKIIVKNNERLIAYKILNSSLENLNKFQDEQSFIDYINNNSFKINKIETGNNQVVKYTRTIILMPNHISTNKNQGTDDKSPHLKAAKITVNWKTNTISKILIAKPYY